MKKPTRQQALSWIKSNARDGDLGAAQRIYVENRISFASYLVAVREGQALAREKTARLKELV